MDKLLFFLNHTFVLLLSEIDEYVFQNSLIYIILLILRINLIQYFMYTGRSMNFM